MNFNKNGEVSRFFAFTALVSFIVISLLCITTGKSEKLLPALVIIGFSGLFAAADAIMKQIQKLLER